MEAEAQPAALAAAAAARTAPERPRPAMAQPAPPAAAPGSGAPVVSEASREAAVRRREVRGSSGAPRAARARRPAVAREPPARPELRVTLAEGEPGPGRGPEPPPGADPSAATRARRSSISFSCDSTTRTSVSSCVRVRRADTHATIGSTIGMASRISATRRNSTIRLLSRGWPAIRLCWTRMAEHAAWSPAESPASAGSRSFVAGGAAILHGGDGTGKLHSHRTPRGRVGTVKNREKEC